MHPEEDYFRLGLSFNEDVNGGEGFTMKEQMKMIKAEKEYLLQCEIDELNKK